MQTLDKMIIQLIINTHENSLIEKHDELIHIFRYFWVFFK
jgi:sulfur relay (sulfurtransferase) DsrC/TusE family protein